jgi:hypothetical protein
MDAATDMITISGKAMRTSECHLFDAYIFTSSTCAFVAGALALFEWRTINFRAATRKAIPMSPKTLVKCIDIHFISVFERVVAML